MKFQYLFEKKFNFFSIFCFFRLKNANKYIYCIMLNDNFGKKFGQKRFKIFFAGIGGASMSALAIILKKRGFIVSGYDREEGETVYALRKKGVPVNEENSLEECDLAVVSSAISSDDAILKKLSECGKTVVSRAWLLARFAECFPVTVGVAGTHGKTTCTCLLAHVFKEAGIGFTLHVGGEDAVLGNEFYSGDDVFLTEICEYKRNISYFSPEIGVLLNIDNDHEESYGSFEKLAEEFNAYKNRCKTAIVCADDENICIDGCVTLSRKNVCADYYSEDATFDGKTFKCAVFGLGERLFEVESKYLAPHDEINLLAATAVSRMIGIRPQVIKRGIEAFEGIKRRNEYLGDYRGVSVYADYAHHPAQLNCVIAEYKKRFGENTLFFFQSHTFSRTERLKDDFIAALSAAKNLCLFETYGARERYCDSGSIAVLARALPNACLCLGKNAVATAFDGFGKGECNYSAAVVLGAGDLYDEVKSFLKIGKIGL